MRCVAACLVGVVLSGLGVGGLGGCTSSGPSSAPGGREGAADAAVLLDTDAAGADADVGPDDAGARSDATVGQSCTFNADCASAERCVCAAGTCACAVGARGALPSGSGPCTSGDDCATSLCLDGPGDVLTCSGPCTRPEDCPPALPRCLALGNMAPFCARDPSAAPDAGVLPACTGDCASTTLSATFGARRGDFTRAQHGTHAPDGLRIEAHFGGDPACPTETSPTPDRTLILSGLRALDRAQTEADGLRASLLDFRGDLTTAPIARATAVRMVPRYFAPGVAVSWTVEATFPEGTISGGVYAPHCDSLDD